jgi:hypothetical protein
MSLSFVDIDSQHVELLPPRTVMSLFATQTPPVSPITISGNHLCGLSIGQLGIGLGLLLALGIGNLSGATSC